MQFVYSALTWGFLLMLVPLAIHLINMMRHRRVQWAAMEFLLASYKKHKQWVWLKQLLLLLSRMAAIALVVAMLARLVSRDTWSALFGGKATHHFVLLDDSYSMQDRVGATSAFDVAGQVVARIAAQAGQSDFEHKLTLVRFSEAARANGDDARALDFNAEPIDANFDVRVEEKRRTFDVTELSIGPEAALKLARQLVSDAAQDQNIVYVVSDFRANEWNAPGQTRQALEQLAEAGTEIRLVNCVRSEQANLGIESIEPSSDTRAAGVPLFVNITVRNHGRQAAKRVQVKVRTHFFDPGALDPDSPEANRGETEELPVVLFDEIPAGETATQRVQVYFPAAGQHVVEATLPDDPVLADNRRYTVIDFPEGEPVLVIDGHPQQRNAFYLTSAFEPGARANTGIRPTVQTPDFLRDATPDSLASYRTIYLLDVPRLDPRGVENLKAFAQAGGGIAIFVGPNVNIASYNNTLYEEGRGILPAPLEREQELLPDPIENKPDVEAERHPVFDPLLAEQNPLIRLVNIERFLRVPLTWQAGKGNTAQVVASLRNRAPLVVEQSFGQGRVLLVLTTAAPDWNSWANDPTFVVFALKMQSYLARAPQSDQGRLVGAPIELELPADNYRPEVTFVVPGERSGSRVVVERIAQASDDEKSLHAALGGTATNPSAAGDTQRAGIYEAWPRATDGTVEPRRMALNVDPREGDLTVVRDSDLVARLAPVKVTLLRFDDDVGGESQAANNFSLPLMGLLLALLVGEQLLAYSASYHPLTPSVR